MRLTVIAAAVAALLGHALIAPRAAAGQAPEAVRGGDPKRLAAAREKKSVPELWMWHMGMLRGVYEIDGVTTLEIQKRYRHDPCRRPAVHARKLPCKH